MVKALDFHSEDPCSFPTEQWHSLEFSTGVHNCIIVSKQCADFFDPVFSSCHRSYISLSKYYIFS